LKPSGGDVVNLYSFLLKKKKEKKIGRFGKNRKESEGRRRVWRTINKEYYYLFTVF
jgi:hypothetical protein